HADRVVALDRGRIAFDGAAEGFLEWAVATDPDLATPAARLFDLAGLRPLPAGVKRARELLGEAAIELPQDSESGAPAAGRARRRRRGAELALEVRRAWVALDPGTGPRDI